MQCAGYSFKSAITSHSYVGNAECYSTIKNSAKAMLKEYRAYLREGRGALPRNPYQPGRTGNRAREPPS